MSISSDSLPEQQLCDFGYDLVPQMANVEGATFLPPCGGRTSNRDEGS
jgi:hypothetical protein